jgi:2,3-bisphosphoglycerate-dependent phosphoglycerate mutase
MGKLVLMRHGESLWNLENLFTGWVDVPLSEKGVQEALAAGQKIADIPFDVAFTSELVRAQQTLALALLKHKSGKVPVFLHEEKGRTGVWAKIYSDETLRAILPVHKSWHLNERMYGALQGLNKAETAKKFGAEQVQEWRRSFATAPPEGESLKTCSERTLPYFEAHIKPLLNQGKTVLVCAHGNSLRSIMMELDRLTPEQVVKLELTLGAPILYECNAGKIVKCP